MTIIVDHLGASSPKRKRDFVALMSRLIFPREGTIGAQVKWVTRMSVTRVTVWGLEHLLNNIRLAVISEALGLGPNHYCIIRSASPNFASKVLLLVRYLPHEKMSIRPIGPPLRGPFMRPLWRTIGEGISRRSIPIGQTPPFYPRCYAWWCREGIFLTPRLPARDYI